MYSAEGYKGGVNMRMVEKKTPAALIETNLMSKGDVLLTKRIY